MGILPILQFDDIILASVAIANKQPPAKHCPDIDVIVANLLLYIVIHNSRNDVQKACKSSVLAP